MLKRKDEDEGSAMSKIIPFSSLIIHMKNKLLDDKSVTSVDLKRKELREGFCQDEIRHIEDQCGRGAIKGTYIASIDHPILWREEKKRRKDRVTKAKSRAPAETAGPTFARSSPPNHLYFLFRARRRRRLSEPFVE